MMQHVEHHHAGKDSIRKRQAMRVGNEVDTRKREDVGRNDVLANFLDVSCAAADIEHASFRTAIEQAPMEIAIQQANRRLVLPYVAMSLLALVQTGRMFDRGRHAIKPP